MRQQRRHRGMLGAVRYAEAEQLERQADAAASLPTAAPGADEEPPADPAPLLEKAVQKALQARNHFVRAIRANPTAEHVRNGERAVRKLEELKQKLEELMQQRQTEPQQQGEDGEEQGEEGQDGEQQLGDPGGEPRRGRARAGSVVRAAAGRRAARRSCAGAAVWRRRGARRRSRSH